MTNLVSDLWGFIAVGFGVIVFFLNRKIKTQRVIINKQKLQNEYTKNRNKVLQGSVDKTDYDIVLDAIGEARKRRDSDRWGRSSKRQA